MTKRLDISGRDPATLTELDYLAFAFPAVYALMLDRDRWRERARDRDRRLMDAITVMDDLRGTRRALARRSVLFRRLARIALERLR